MRMLGCSASRIAGNCRPISRNASALSTKVSRRHTDEARTRVSGSMKAVERRLSSNSGRHRGEDAGEMQRFGGQIRGKRREQKDDAGDHRVAVTTQREVAQERLEKQRGRETDQRSSDGNDDKRRAGARERERARYCRRERKAVKHERRRIVHQTLAADYRGDAAWNGDALEDRL